MGAANALCPNFQAEKILRSTKINFSKKILKGRIFQENSFTMMQKEEKFGFKRPGILNRGFCIICADLGPMFITLVAVFRSRASAPPDISKNFGAKKFRTWQRTYCDAAL